MPINCEYKPIHIRDQADIIATIRLRLYLQDIFMYFEYYIPDCRDVSILCLRRFKLRCSIMSFLDYDW